MECKNFFGGRGKSIVILFCLFFGLYSFAQQKKHVLFDVETLQSFSRKDSAMAVKFLDSLVQQGYYLTEIKEVRREGDVIYIQFDKKRGYRKVEVEVSDSLAQALGCKKNFFSSNIDSLKMAWNQEFVQKGYVFNRVKTMFLGMKNEIPRVRVSIVKGEQRRINRFIIKGYEKVPNRFVKNLIKSYRSSIYTEKVLLALQRDLQNHHFVSLERPPQTLFSRDSTQIFLFLQRKKVNSFDAMVGFANDKSEKFNFSGTINVQFKNIFNTFESMGLYWQRTPEKSQTFNFVANFPYILDTNVGTDLQLNIHRQQDDFANVLFSPALFYNVNNHQKVGIKANVEISTTEKSENSGLRNYSKRGIGLSYQYVKPTLVEIFGHASLLLFEGYYLANQYHDIERPAQQYKFLGKIEQNIRLYKNHWLNTKVEGGVLRSDLPLIVNEAFRFGGWNSFRGFNENILLAHRYYFAGLEYRYLIGNQAFFDVFGQYGQIYQSQMDLNIDMYSIGLGFHFYLPIGLMSFQIANGVSNGQIMKFSDAKIHWGIVSRF